MSFITFSWMAWIIFIAYFFVFSAVIRILK